MPRKPNVDLVATVVTTPAPDPTFILPTPPPPMDARDTIPAAEDDVTEISAAAPPADADQDAVPSNSEAFEQRAVVNASQGLCLRPGPDQDFPPVSILPYGTLVIVTEDAFPWATVRTPAGLSGYAMIQYLTAINE